MKCDCLCHILPNKELQCDICGCTICSACGKSTTIKQLERKEKSCNCEYCYSCGHVVHEDNLQYHKEVCLGWR